MTRIALPILLLSIVLPAWAQRGSTSELGGRVVDVTTDAPVVQAHVFLDGTSLGDVTREDGTFRLTGIPVGTFELVVSHVGYELHQRIIRFEEGRMPDLDIRLRERVTSTDEVVVTAERDREWARLLEQFLRMFMGTGAFARECVLRNPEVLDFTVNPVLGILNARAARALEIENRALGYDVTYWMDYFGGNDHHVEFSGKAYFEPRMPESDREARRWSSRRREAYVGSVRHFLAAAARGRLMQEDFRAAGAGQPGGGEAGFLDTRFVDRDTLTGLFVIRFPRAIRVEYLGEPEAMEYASDDASRSARIDGPLRKQVSWLTLRAPMAHFDANGRLQNPLNLVRYGYWGWEERMAYSLPWDYAPDVE